MTPAEAGWWPLALADEVRASAPRPVPVTLDATPWALAVMADEVHALHDLCPHRRVPLSAGTVVESDAGPALECGYHGWSFGPDGACVRIPALGEGVAPRGMRGPAVLAVRELAGIVWGSSDPDAELTLVDLPVDPVALRPLVVEASASVVARVLDGSSLWLALRPVDQHRTEVFAVVDGDDLQAGLEAWLQLSERLAESLAPSSASSKGR